MSLASFLDRLVAPGNYIAVAFQGNKGLGNRFYPRNQCDEAASFCRWASDQRGMDTWYAPASFTEATLRDDGNGYRGRRTQANTQNIKSFWFDADIKRAGDGKDPAKVFATRAELVQWTKDFSQATGFPLPNVWVCSGYGTHLYWTLTDALDRATWQPYADGLKTLLAAHGAKGDLAVVADAARILRPIETFNYKDRTHPAACYFLIDQPDYPNADVLTKLVVTTGSGKRPKAASQLHTSMAANAQAGMSAAPRDFALIAQHCPQVARSLAEGGANDGRQLWRGMLTLAHFCEDGRDWAHQIGENHPTYDPAKTDAEVDLIEQEYQAKKFGATLCKTFDTERTGVCATCPHHNRITTPFALGLALAAPSSDLLPPKYRCINSRVEMDAGENGWVKILSGEVKNPLLEHVEGEPRLTFDYERTANGAVEVTRVSVTASEMHGSTSRAVLARRGLYLLGGRSPIPEMLMAWMDRLRDACKPRSPLPAFGWYREGSFDGFAVAGQFYNADGTTHLANCDDDILKRYSSRGTVANWLTAAKFVIGNVPGLHTALALSFGAPLMKFSGATGGCISFVGPSGIGKTSVFRAGVAVWGHPVTSMLNLDDTVNYRMKFLGEAKAIPVYWDEARLTTSKDGVEQCLDMLHKLTQGRDKGRLGPDLQARDAGMWRTIYALATNASVTDLIVNHQGHKSPAMLRVLEVELNHGFKPTPGADRIVDTLEDNYGCVGHEYARYIATHQNVVRDAYQRVEKHIHALLNGQWSQDERFHIALVCCVVTGALIAKKALGVPFDVNGIAGVLVEAMNRSRADRREVEPVRQIGVGRVLDDFVNDYASRLIITAQIKRAGGPVGPAGPNLTQPVLPTDRMKVPVIQIAVDDKALRLDKREFRRWCSDKQIPCREMLDLMHQQWHTTGAMRGSLYRGMIGAGERWHTHGNVLLVEINLDRQELQHILDSAADALRPPSALPVVGGNVIPLPPRPASPPPVP